MKTLTKPLFLCILLFSVSYNQVSSISCFQCVGSDSNDPFECNEYLPSDTELVATNCSSIHNAQFCIKHVGRFEVAGIECFQCNSSTTMECGDGLMKLDGGVLAPASCAHVHDAQYCIKQTGGISTKRSCSALDLGNYCSYVQQPGDKLEYRTCIYTCSADGCNSANNLRISIGIILGIILVGSLNLFESIL